MRGCSSLVRGYRGQGWQPVVSRLGPSGHGGERSQCSWLWLSTLTTLSPEQRGHRNPRLRNSGTARRGGVRTTRCLLVSQGPGGAGEARRRDWFGSQPSLLYQSSGGCWAARVSSVWDSPALEPHERSPAEPPGPAPSHLATSALRLFSQSEEQYYPVSPVGKHECSPPLP